MPVSDVSFLLSAIAIDRYKTQFDFEKVSKVSPTSNWYQEIALQSQLILSCSANLTNIC